MEKAERCQIMKPAGDPGELSDLSRETLRRTYSMTDKDTGKIFSRMKTFFLFYPDDINACFALITYRLHFSLEIY